MTSGFYDRVTEPGTDSHPGFIRLTCHDCGGEVRFRNVPAGRDRADQMLSVHKSSGCCADRQAAARRRAA